MSDLTRKTLTKANYCLKAEYEGQDNPIDVCLNCHFGYEGKSLKFRCQVHKVNVAENGYCDDYE